jgi:uncharacterized protein (DUF1015 family)
VPRFEPFCALRYATHLSLDLVSAPPYDVLSAADVDGLERRHPDNIVHVDIPRPEADLHRYEAAADRLVDWERDGVLVRDDNPSFTLYRMRFESEAGRVRETVGVIGALEVVDEGAGGVLPHERTTPKAKTDRLDLTRATQANLSPVWGLSLTAGLTALLQAPGEPMGSCTDEHGVVHTVERVSDAARVVQISEAIASHPVLIADGHHRYAISRTYRDERRATDGAGPWDLTLAYVGELVDDQLSIDAIHRVYPGTDDTTMLALLSPDFEPSAAGPVDPSFAGELVRRGALCLVHPNGTGTWLTPRPGRFDGVRALDGALLEHSLRAGDIDVTYQHGISEVVAMVRSGAAGTAVLIRPTGIEEIRRTADEALLMPPKSTFFTPKLRTGLVVRPLTT